MNYYNEFEPYAAQWLRNLIKEGLLPEGDVDERDIKDVTPRELMGYTQCHFFAGIGGWPYALRLAGWPDDKPVWTGSCPCQSFSAAGRGKGGADERHLWPFWFHLIRVCKPSIVFGEQVASKLALSWLDLVCDDLEAEGYACGAADLPAGSVGAPHIRQRLWWVAYANEIRRYAAKPTTGTIGCISGESKSKNGSPTLLLGHASDPRCEEDGLQQVRGAGEGRGQDSCTPRPSSTGELADCECKGLEERESQPGNLGQECQAIERDSNAGSLADTSSTKRRPESQKRSNDQYGNDPRWQEETGRYELDRQTNNFWSSAVWLPCRDGKWRPTGIMADTECLRFNNPLVGENIRGSEDKTTQGEGGQGKALREDNNRVIGEGYPDENGNLSGPTQSIIQPLAHGVPARVGKLRAAGNAIVPQVAAEFVKAVMESL